MPRILRPILGLTALALVALAVTAWESAPRSTDAAGKASGQWTQVGCIKLQNSDVCRDVYADGSGNLWLCAGCGRTKVSNPAKCRLLTSDDIASGTWCGGS